MGRRWSWVLRILFFVVRGQGDVGKDTWDETISSQLNQFAVGSDTNKSYESLPSAQEWRDAPSCPLWGPMDSFYKEGIEKGRYLGRWWLQDKHSELSDLGGKCWSQVYSVDYINKTIYRQTDYQTSIGSFPRTDSGLVTIEDLRDSNLLTFTPEESFLPSSPEEYRVLATDYSTFTIEYSCADTNLLRRNERIWIYTRDKLPVRSVLKRAYKSLKVLGLSGWKLKKTDQTCKESPPPKPLQVRRTYEVTTTQPPFIRLGTPAITTGQLTAKMLGSGLKMAQTVLAPWTLHPQLGLGIVRGRVGQERRVKGRGWDVRRSGGQGKVGRSNDMMRLRRRKNSLNVYRSKKRRNWNLY